MRVLCLHVGHDNNCCIYDSNSLELKYIKEERVSGNKHDHTTRNIIDFINNSSPVDIIVLAYSHIKTPNELALYEKYSNAYDLSKNVNRDTELLLSKFPKLKYSNGATQQQDFLRRYYDILTETNNLNLPIYCIQHDYAHILSGWMLGTKYEYGVSIDGGGPDLNNKLILKNPFDLNKVEILFFSRLTNTLNTKSDCYTFNNINSLGSVLNIIGKIMRLQGMDIDHAGKIMGLSAYGNIQQNIIDQFNSCCLDVSKFNINDFTKKIFGQFLEEPFSLEKDFTDKCNIRNQKFLNVVSSIQYIWTRTVFFLFQKFIPKKSSVIYSGGCAQNTITNKFLLHDYPDLDVVPHCYDGGLSLGCLGFFILKNGIDFPILQNFPYNQTDISVDAPSENTIKKVAKLLSDGKIVGWYQGHGELGPRALGNRSILMNPSILNGKDILNSKVKHREQWRPFAPSILEEHADEWFDMNKSKYMMFAANVKPEKRKLIPAVTHEDGTSRIQTVCHDDNKVFYALLKEFYKITNIPMLLNTSLNSAGGPIAGRPEQAIDIYNNSEMDAVCIGNALYVKNHNNKDIMP